MNKLLKTTLLLAVLFVGTFALPVLVGDAVYAQNPIQVACDESESASALCEDTEGNSVTGVVGIVVNVLLFVVGLVSGLMLIIGGLRYITSNGDSGALTSAKNTILYSIVGLVVALVAYAVVRWVFRLF